MMHKSRFDFDALYLDDRLAWRAVVSRSEVRNVFLDRDADIVSTAATDLAGIASNLGAANSAAAAATTGVLPAPLD